MSLQGKKILCGVTGSIAVYKVCDWVRSIQKEGAEVTVVMTESACRFVSPLTFAALSGNKVYSDMFEEQDAENIPHISLAREHDIILIAPATAQTIAKLALGLADNLLSTVVLASTAPVVVCPAMNSKMYLNAATQENIGKLKAYGRLVMEPDHGAMACGEEGPGRLPGWQQVRNLLIGALSPQDLSGKTVLVTAGPTEEPLDPVRFLGNRSSGKMGYAMAVSARRRGARVILVSGPTHLAPPPGVELIAVRTAEEMYTEVMGRADVADIIVKAAAVSDFRPREREAGKIKKERAKLTIALDENRDILQKLGEVKGRRKNPLLLLGFAAESEDLVRHGREKLEKKNLDFIAVNDITGDDSGFAVDTNRIILLGREGEPKEFPLLTKEETADRIWDEVLIST